MKKTVVFLVFIWLTTACIAFGQTGSSALDSYHRGLRIVESSFNAMGGNTASDKIDDISFNLTGVFYARNQSWKPDTQFDKFPMVIKIIFDLKNDRMSWAQRNKLPGGILFDNLGVVPGKDPSFLLDRQRMIYTRLSAQFPVRDQAIGLMPIVFLKRILQQKIDVRWIGEATVNGKNNDVVDVFWNGTSYSLYFDKENKLLAKQENLAPDATVGDDWLESYTSDYQNVEGLLLPTKCRQWQSGKLVLDTNYVDYKLNQKLDDALFRLPANYTLFQRPTFAFRSVAKNVYVAEGLVGGGYRSLIVDLDDSILVVDSPGNSQVSNRVINEIGKVIPNKPIKYLVETHYHDDHTGGIRPYVAEGTKIVTTSRNRTFFEQMVAAEHTLMPDVLSNKPQKPDFIFVENRQTFGHGEHLVEVVNIGGPHTEDMYLIYLPNERIVFQSDLYNWAEKAVTESTIDMVEKIAKLGWPVETVIGSHSGTVPYRQIQNEVKAFKESK